jgi:predicted aspartyl protease
MALAECGFDDSPESSGAELLAMFGPTLLVDVGFDPRYRPVEGAKAPRPALKGVQALVDTGATESHIDDQLATQLRLPIADRRPIGGAVGVHDADVYLAQIFIPHLEFTIYGQFAGVKLADSGFLQRALIGRTFLRGYTMVYTGTTGKVTLSD